MGRVDGALIALGGVIATTAVVLVGGAAGARAASPASVELPDAADEVIVKFRPSVDTTSRGVIRRRAAVHPVRTMLAPSTQVVEVESGSAEAAAARLEREPGVEYAEPNHRYRKTASEPNDEHFRELWGLHNHGQSVNGSQGVANVDIDVLDAWDTALGTGQVVAVLDTGVALDHVDLAGNLWRNPGETADGQDNADPGQIVDDIHGADFVQRLEGGVPTGDPEDSDGHGTHVAGTIAAVANNGVGIAGVAPEAKIMAVKVLNDNGAGFLDDILDGMDYAVQHGADVINMSLGGPLYSQAWEEAIDRAIEAGAVVVVAAGNDGHNNDGHDNDPDDWINAGAPTYPCNFDNPGLVCVAAHDPKGALSWFSNFGATSVDVAAPGTSTYSAMPHHEQVEAVFNGHATETFEHGANGWFPLTDEGLQPWGIDAAGRNPETSESDATQHSAADSPGGNYELPGEGLKTAGFVSPPLTSLTGRKGCRVRFWARVNYGDGIFIPGIIRDGLAMGLGLVWDQSGTTFTRYDYGIDDVRHPGGLNPEQDRLIFSQWTWATGTATGDGVNVDDVSVWCRTSPSSGHRFLSGTSMATPHVAGIVALLRERDPDLPPDAVRRRLVDTAIPVPSMAGRTVSGGRVNAARALDPPASPEPSEPVDPAPQPVPSPPPPLPAPTPSPSPAPHPSPAPSPSPAPTPTPSPTPSPSPPHAPQPDPIVAHQPPPPADAAPRIASGPPPPLPTIQQPAPTPQPNPTPPSPGVTVQTRAVSVGSKSTSAAVALRCPAGASAGCRGTATLQVIGRRGTATRIGSARFTIARGKRATVKIKLNRRARNQLRRARTVQLTVTSTGLGPTTRTLTVRARR